MWWVLPVGLALGGEPAPTSLISRPRIGLSLSKVEGSLKGAGATGLTSAEFDQPGAFAMGLLDRPGMLAMLNRVGVRTPFFTQLPKRGPSFMVARIGEARGAYAFVSGKLWSMAATLPYDDVAPSRDPFDPDRMRRLGSTLDALCPGLKSAQQDEYRNSIAWQSNRCSDGKAMVWYQPGDVEAALQVVVYGR